MVRYAQAEQDKEARRDDILGAALALFLEDTRRLPAVAAIAAQAGLAKGTVYLYFKTKEQIFAALLSREWDALLAKIEENFAASTGPKEAVVGRFIDGFVAFLASHSYFLRLDSLGYGHLEANLPPDEFWRFKQSFSLALNRAGQAVDRALLIPPGDGLALLLRSYALTRGLYQTLDFPDRVRGDNRFHDHPLARIDFDVELQTALLQYWRGALGDLSE
ncbi:TetR family transcriptional regulator [Devosia sp. BK]|uniref:TetR family transcriptional regulator n=1 Tax=Devosia sp. BK TaxID=2871706 RepID=UPI00293B3FD3|nr:TetR family transcriptional regulator [Devosia sp. BK]MDV3253738.1 TetR family transcriptional regulator [Devosia sp. BK]